MSPGNPSGSAVRRIVVAGGGTAGWLAASYLNRALGPDVKITLVESDDVPPIGVGEATVPTLGTTMRFLGLEDRDWMPAVNATYKAAIRFVGWSRNVDAGGARLSEYWHPFREGFERYARPWAEPYFGQIGDGIASIHYALARRLSGKATGLLADQLVPTLELCRRNLSPKNPVDPTHDVRTAYHLDAVLLGQFLRELACGRGVERIVDHITNVQRDPVTGNVSALGLRSGRRLEADLWIDCSGFRSLLLGKSLEEPFLSDSGHLLCDSAIALPTRHKENGSGIPPYTTARAMSAGWSWDIPLSHRRGCGYVYSQAFITPEEAEAELRKLVGDAAEGNEARRIGIRVGRYRRTWVKNVVALGLAAAFLEPLESTSIFLIEYGLANLVTFFPHSAGSEAHATAFNREMNDVYEELRDFILMHYVLANRADTPFWKSAASDAVLTDSLAEQLQLYEESLPLQDSRTFALFRGFSHTCILDGNGRAPAQPHPLFGLHGTDAGDRMLDDLAKRREACVASMPTHAEVIEEIYRR